jgi:hypothetical protein
MPDPDPIRIEPSPFAAMGRKPALEECRVLQRQAKAGP